MIDQLLPLPDLGSGLLLPQANRFDFLHMPRGRHADLCHAKKTRLVLKYGRDLLG